MSEETKGVLPSIMIVDDEESVRTSLREILKGQFSIVTAGSAEEALEIIRQNLHGDGCGIDVVVSDICMTHMDGLALLKEIKRKNQRVEVIMVTGYPSPDNTLHALRFGASDYIVKPFQAPEVVDSVKRVMDKRKESVRMEKMIEELHISVQKNYHATTEALIMAIDAKDNYTKEHCARVSYLIEEFSRYLRMNEEDVDLLKSIGKLHDIGKIGIREEILTKSSSLNAEEWDEMKQHPYIGYQIIQSVEFLSSVRDVILYHHERYDGNGYPTRLQGNRIPLGARMLSIVDSYDAMVIDRPYRKKLSIPNALTELDKCKGRQFDPELTNAFVGMIRDKYSYVGSGPNIASK